MISFSFMLFSQNFSVEVNIKGVDFSSIFEFGLIFYDKVDFENKEVKLSEECQLTDKAMEAMEAYVNKYREMAPQIQRLHAYLKRMERNEWFLLLPISPVNTREDFDLKVRLMKLNGEETNELTDSIDSVYDVVMENYEIISFNLSRPGKIKIGESAKKLRVCRFCKKSISSGITFDKEAHAISEAIGNKKIILNEECDSCNEFFDEKIERDFIYYHDLIRTIYGVKNKDNKIPKIKNNDIFIENDDGINIGLLGNVEKDANGLPKSVSFDSGQSIRYQSMYKALCKYALSVIDQSHIEAFDSTIAWLRGDAKSSDLPKVAVWGSDKCFSKQPEITLYIRKGNDHSIPYLVADLKIACYIYGFIIPFCKNDSLSFTEERDYSNFLSCFKNYSSAVGDFKCLDYSDDSQRDLNFKINFEQINTNGG